MELEVLVATMGQVDCSLAQKMNIQTPVVIANQCGRWGYAESASGRVRMLSTDTKGVGTNRNFALQLAKAEILLFADDDVTYYDGTLQGVMDAFVRFPDADVIFFGMDMTRGGQVFEKRRNRVGRVYLWNALRYGAARMAIRRSAVRKARLTFSPFFGGGCQYGSGEDTIFIRDCFRAGLKAYSSDYVLGRCTKDSSTWFTGFHEKYFFDRGAMVACGFPWAKHLVKWHFVWKDHRKTGVPAKKILKDMNRGIHAFQTLTAYAEYREQNKEGLDSGGSV